MKKKTFLEVGKVISIHGVKGFVKLIVWCNDISLFKSLSFLYFDPLGKLKNKIERVSFKKNTVLIKFYNINTVGLATDLVGKILYVNRSDIKLQDGENFIEDLIGVRIHNYFKKEVYYGKIVNVLSTGANDVYVIKDKKGKEKYVPVIKDVVLKKDIDKNIIYINVLEGLFDV